MLADPDVRAGRLDTGLLDRRGTPAAAEPDDDDLARRRARARRSRDAGSGPGLGTVDARTDGAPAARHGIRTPTASCVDDVGDRPVYRVGRTGRPRLGTPRDGSVLWLRREGRTLELADARAAPSASPSMLASIVRASGPVSPELRTQMPGTVVAVPVADGDHVAAGDTIVTVEAMKMESPLTAPVAGIVRVSVRVGDLVRRDQVVAVIEEAAPEAAAPTKRKAPTKKKDAV